MDESGGSLINIRLAGPADATCLSSMGRRAYRQHFTYLWEPEVLDQYLAQAYHPDLFKQTIEAENGRIWLATYQEQLCGYLMYFADKRLPDRAEKGAYINRLYLLREFMGRRIGSLLMQRALTEARAAGMPYVWLEVMQSNVQSMDFYRRHGFSIHGATQYSQFPMRTEALSRMWWMICERNLQ